MSPCWTAMISSPNNITTIITARTIKITGAPPAAAAPPAAPAAVPLAAVPPAAPAAAPASPAAAAPPAAAPLAAPASPAAGQKDGSLRDRLRQQDQGSEGEEGRLGDTS